MRPSWIFDNITQSESDGDVPTLLLPLEPRFVLLSFCAAHQVTLTPDRHMFFMKAESKSMIESNIDEYGDSFARDVSLDELREVTKKILQHASHLLMYYQISKEMPNKYEHTFSPSKFRAELSNHDHDLGELPGWMFRGLLLCVDEQNTIKTNGASFVVQPNALEKSAFGMKQAIIAARFAGAEFTTDLANDKITHVLVENDKRRAKMLREIFSTHVFFVFLVELLADATCRRKRLPRLVTVDWVEQSWKERTLLDEERKISRDKGLS